MILHDVMNEEELVLCPVSDGYNAFHPYTGILHCEFFFDDEDEEEDDINEDDNFDNMDDEFDDDFDDDFDDNDDDYEDEDDDYDYEDDIDYDDFDE